MIGPRASLAVIAVVTVLWVANFIATLTVDGYRPSESVNGAFAAVIGVLVAMVTRSTKPEQPEEESADEEGETNG